MNYKCKKHTPPFIWHVAPDLPESAQDALKICPCGIPGEPCEQPAKKQRTEKVQGKK